MKLIMENWRGFLKEIDFYDQQPDYDKMPGGGKSVVVFDPETDYDKEGNTHGGVSHSIKHYMEFDSSSVEQAVKQAASIVSKLEKVFIKKAEDDSVLSQGDDAKQAVLQNPNIMLNTFDLINDKMLNSISLSDSEKQLLPIIEKIFSKYKQLAEKLLTSAIDTDKTDDAAQILQLLKTNKPIKFTATYGGSEKIYALNPENTAIVSYMDNKMSTFFKVDKKGSNKQKVLRYFTKGLEIKNPAVLKALQEWAGPASEQPQQQQKKKEKPQQKKKAGAGDVVRRLKQANKTDDQIKQILSKAFPNLPEKAVANMLTNIKEDLQNV